MTLTKKHPINIFLTADEFSQAIAKFGLDLAKRVIDFISFQISSDKTIRGKI